MGSALPLLVVDGYNVIYGTPRYQALIDDDASGADAGADFVLGGDGAATATPAASTAAHAYSSDPFDRAREALLADVAAYAQGRFEPVIVFDAAGNVAPERPNPVRAGVRLVFSQTGESGDAVIERLVTRARHAGRSVTLVTSDNTIRYTVGGEPVTVVSSALLVADIEIVSHDVDVARSDRAHGRMTLESRLPVEQRERLWQMLGR